MVYNLGEPLDLQDDEITIEVTVFKSAEQFVTYEVNSFDELVFEIKPNTSGFFAGTRDLANYLISITLTDDDEHEPLSTSYRFWINLYKDALPDEQEEQEIEEEEDEEIEEEEDESWQPPDEVIPEPDWEAVDEEGYLIYWDPQYVVEEHEVVDLRNNEEPIDPEAPIPRIVSLDQFGLLTISWNKIMDIPSNLTEIKPENVTVVETNIED